MNGLIIAAVYGITLAGGLWPFGGDEDKEDTSGTIGELQEREIELKTEVVVPGGEASVRDQYRCLAEIGRAHV